MTFKGNGNGGVNLSIGRGDLTKSSMLGTRRDVGVWFPPSSMWSMGPTWFYCGWV